MKKIAVAIFLLFTIMIIKGCAGSGEKASPSSHSTKSSRIETIYR